MTLVRSGGGCDARPPTRRVPDFATDGTARLGAGEAGAAAAAHTDDPAGVNPFTNNRPVIGESEQRQEVRGGSGSAMDGQGTRLGRRHPATKDAAALASDGVCPSNH